VTSACSHPLSAIGTGPDGPDGGLLSVWGM